MPIPDKIEHILNDRESGSVSLLNRLIRALEELLRASDPKPEEFHTLLITVRKELQHFAAIDNFLGSLIPLPEQKKLFPGNSLRFIADYGMYWQDSPEKIAKNFLLHADPEGKILVTHSHSETIISLLELLHQKEITFRVLQTRSIPGEEGRRSYERMRERKLQVELIDDQDTCESLRSADLVVLGCDALLEAEFLNKIGTRRILEEANQLKLPSYLICESRKEIKPSDRSRTSKEHPLFEWVPLNLINTIVTERRS